MAQTVPKLPDDIDTLKALVLVNQRQLAAKDSHIAILEEKLRLAAQKRFGASSETADDDQLGLFNEAEQASCDDGSPEATASDETTVVPEYTRKKPGRKPLSDHLPRRRLIDATSIPLIFVKVSAPVRLLIELQLPSHKAGPGANISKTQRPSKSQDVCTRSSPYDMSK